MYVVVCPRIQENRMTQATATSRGMSAHSLHEKKERMGVRSVGAKSPERGCLDENKYNERKETTTT